MSVGLALHDKSSNYYIVFIDQTSSGKENQIFSAAKKIGSIFHDVWCLPSRKDGESKARVRSLGFAQLRDILVDIEPSEIITGNDRRLEFQYAMHFSKAKLKLDVLGSFLDDGTGSYISFQNSKLIRYLSDRYIDTPIKKLVYGKWYCRPEVFGASQWVGRCYLAHPEVASKPLQCKELIELKRGYYLCEEAVQYFQSLSIELGVVSLGGIGSEDTVLFVLPHSSIINEVYGSVDELKNVLFNLAGTYSNICFKYHPREKGDPLKLNETGKSLAASIPAELYYVVNQFDLIIGDVSTALMAAKWLNPNADVQYFKTASKQAELVAGLFQYLGIEPLKTEGAA